MGELVDDRLESFRQLKSKIGEYILRERLAREAANLMNESTTERVSFRSHSNSTATT